MAACTALCRDTIKQSSLLVVDRTEAGGKPADNFHPVFERQKGGFREVDGAAP